MTAMKGQAKDKLMVIKLFSINYARDLVKVESLFITKLAFSSHTVSFVVVVIVVG